jgi:hypothetical protein
LFRLELDARKSGGEFAEAANPLAVSAKILMMIIFSCRT